MKIAAIRISLFICDQHR